MLYTFRRVERPEAASIATRMMVAGRSAGGQMTSADFNLVGPTMEMRCGS